MKLTIPLLLLAPPVDGDSVWIPANKSVTLDVDSPILQLLLIEGTLVFDNLKNLSLQAHYILLHNGGRLQIGTESKPYNNSGLIRLWGNIRNRVRVTFYFSSLRPKLISYFSAFADIWI